MIRIKIVVVGLFLLLCLFFFPTLQDGDQKQITITFNECDVNVSSVLEWRTLL